MDFQLTEQQSALQDIARKFAYEEIQPRARELERAVDPRDTYPIDLVRRASQLGLRTMKIPVKYGGLGADCVTEAVVMEEIAVGDAGFAMTLQHEWREGYLLATCTTDEQRERFLPEFMADETYLTSFASTEDHSGTDNSFPYDGDLGAGPQTFADLRGDEWVINGRKRFITNGNVSRVIVLFARTDRTVPWSKGLSCLLVPRTAPGLGVGRVEDKLGIRLNQNAEIIFDNCRIPKENLVGEVNQGLEVRRAVSGGSKAKESGRLIGAARAAYEAALTWAREHSEGGEPLIAQQRILATLGDMAIDLEAARSLMWRAARAVDQRDESARALEDIVKTFSGDAAMRTVLRALEIFGQDGVRRDLPMEKLFRDASSMLHGGGGPSAMRVRLGLTVSQQRLPYQAARPVGVS